MKSKDYFLIDWASLVYFDIKSDSFLTWLHNKKFAGWKNYKRNGKPSGWRLEYKGRAYYCHKIIAILELNLKDNDLVINHKDCNPFNNCLNNLEICTHKENSRRQSCHIGVSLHPTNTSGIVGVSEHTTGSNMYARAQWNDLDGKIITKYFPYSVYGKDLAIKLASEYRQQALKQLNIDGAGYNLGDNMKNNDVIICNAIVCPDGTYLRSYHRHDYKEHKDTLTGEVFIVDGGNDYLRRSINTTPPKFMDVYLSDPFEVVREAFVWKSYGKNYEHPHGIYIKLCDMTTEHIEAILETQRQIKGTYVEMLFKKELVLRTGTVTLGENDE